LPNDESTTTEHTERRGKMAIMMRADVQRIIYRKLDGSVLGAYQRDQNDAVFLTGRTLAPGEPGIQEIVYRDSWERVIFDIREGTEKPIGLRKFREWCGSRVHEQIISEHKKLVAEHELLLLREAIRKSDEKIKCCMDQWLTLQRKRNAQRYELNRQEERLKSL
jgi:hypothetical protein